MYLFHFQSCDWASSLCKAVSELKQLLLEDEGIVSAYEIYSSGLVEVLLQLLTTSPHDQSDEVAEVQKLGIEIFVKCFKVIHLYLRAHFNVISIN